MRAAPNGMSSTLPRSIQPAAEHASVAVPAWAVGLLAALLATFSACVGSLGSWGAGAVLVGVMTGFMLPGVLIAGCLYRGSPGSWITAVCLGPAWGFGLSSVVLLGFWALGLRTGWLVVAAPATASLAVAGARRLSPAVRSAAMGRGDLAAILALLLLVPVICGRPYSQVGVRMPDGKAYRAYFTADFVWAMAVVGEVSKGDFPPENPFLRGDTLHYYWLENLLPSLEHRIAGRAVPVEQILLTNALMLGAAFVGFLYAFVRHFVARPAAAAAACTLALLLSSFEGVDRLVALWAKGEPLTNATGINIDAVTAWVYSNLPVDGLHRLLLYQPHHATAWALGLSALLVVAVQALEPTRPWVNLVCGVLLGGALLLSSFIGIMTGACVGLIQVARILRRRAWRAAPFAAVAGLLPVALAVLAALGLQYADRAHGLVAFGLNPRASGHLPAALLLSFGPVLIMAAVGTWAALRAQAPHAGSLLVAVAVSLVFYLFVDVIDHRHVYVGRRAGHLLFIAGAALAGVALEKLWARGRRTRIVWSTALALMAVAAAPTTAIDLFNAQDVANRGMGPGFRWTLLLTDDELKALAWVRLFTPPDALVQVEPTVRDQDTWAYVPAFAERRMSAGLPTSMVPLEKYRVASKQVRNLYRSSSSASAYDRARRLHIDYLVVGPPERAAYPQFEPLLDDAPQWFAPVFRNASMSVFAVYRSPDARDGRRGRVESTAPGAREMPRLPS